MFEWLFGNNEKENQEKLKRLMANLPPGPPRKEQASAIFCGHANENPNTCECPDNCYCQNNTCKDRIVRRVDGKTVAVQPPEDTCLMCDREIKDGSGWQFIWKGKEGYMHRDTCGRDFHTIGYYLLDKAQETLEREGIQVIQTKEKFGIMTIYTKAQNEIERKIVKAFQERWQDMYPDFDWYFS